ncbi:MAG: ferredoxin--NADP reductase, partial [Pseudomonadota bacterium]
LIIDNLLPGRRLYLLSTGTGLAPFMSIIRDPETYERFDHIVLVHGCRYTAELAYTARITEEMPNDEFFGELVREKLIYYPTVTREPFVHCGRVTDLITSGKLFADIGLPELNGEEDRVMLCGNPNLIVDMRKILEDYGLSEGSNNRPGQYVIERAFVEK